MSDRRSTSRIANGGRTRFVGSHWLPRQRCLRHRFVPRGYKAGWIERLRADAAGTFPEKVTAFRKDMAVHGRYGKPCPVCGTAIQRIRYAENETNYCPRCQTGGKLLADRSLSRLLKDDWPKTIEALENQRKS